MRFLCLIASMAVLANGITIRAGELKLPYDAVVDLEEGADVWSGANAEKFYRTSKLNKGDRVRVIRHDPGGWCMILPPQGSFSWVRSKYIDRDEAGRGTLNDNRVKVHVGSEVNPDEFLTYQAELSKGDAVVILGEQTFQFDDVPVLMLKIKPVKNREWRWIKRKSIVPANSIQADPFPTEPVAPRRRREPVAEEDSDGLARPISTGPSSQDDRREASFENADDKRVERGNEQSDAKQKLSAIDLRFRDMIQQDPPVWDLESLEDDYEQLDADIGQPWMAAEIGRRLDAVKRYRRTQKDYVEFFKITSDSKQRDAELLLAQSQLQTPGQRPVSNNPDLQPIPQGPNGSAPALQPQQQQPATVPQFDGAGIVQKLATTSPGGPQFVLIAPDGRMLSILQPGPGVDLNRYNGRSMGVIGQRVRREDWNADIITVRSLQPVQLRGSR